jgi:hypothetical protein
MSARLPYGNAEKASLSDPIKAKDIREEEMVNQT